jgi:F420-0:gamma-glutamyl ligase
MQNTGVIARGIVTPMFRQGDDVIDIICGCLMKAADAGGFTLADNDIVAVTEAAVGRTQGNYATHDQIAKDIRAKFGGGTLGIVFPILSRNRFAILKGVAAGCDKLIIQLSYPCDEVGNKLVDITDCDARGVNPHIDSFTEPQFRSVFGKETTHAFTGVDYIEYYKKIAKGCEIVFSNDPKYLLRYTENVLVCDIHTRFRTQSVLKKAGAGTCLRLDEIMTEPVDGSGWSEYGLLGSNKASENTVKLFPRDTKEFVLKLQAEIKKRSGATVETMVYGDGCFKDPVVGIWELADPVVAPAYTEGLAGTPNELKIKYIADTEFADISGDELTHKIRERVKEKKANLAGKMESEGTTPRKVYDLVGSLCDLVSGSGDRGTPVVLVQNYFKNYASEA